jgi:glycosyltransferase involved in cell wall biosynthesis
MRIGIDATCWTDERGHGRFNREIVTAMVSERPHHEFVCLFDERSAGVPGLNAPNVSTVTVPQFAPTRTAASSGSRRSLADMLRLTRAVRQASLDVFMVPSVHGHFPLPPGLPAVVSAHDVIAERLPTLKERLLSKATQRLALMQARLVLAVSDHAARETATHFKVPASRIRVTLKGVSDVYRRTECADEIRAAAERARLPAGARWLTYVGGFGSDRHVDVIVRAHAAAARQQRDRPLMLVLIGRPDCPDSNVAGVRKVIKECGTEHLVRWVGFLPDPEVRHLHSGALALVLVSSFERFGLPAVEAARCGTPVIATTESPLPDLLDGGGVFVPPGDVTALQRAIERFATDECQRARMGIRALERASELSWRRSGRVALDALEEVARRAEKLGSSTYAGT